MPLNSIGRLNSLNFYRFSSDEMKRLYRIFKSECPSGLITEEVFYNIFSKFFPLGTETYNGKCKSYQNIISKLMSPVKDVDFQNQSGLNI